MIISLFHIFEIYKKFILNISIIKEHITIKKIDRFIFGNKKIYINIRIRPVNSDKFIITQKIFSSRYFWMKMLFFSGSI